MIISDDPLQLIRKRLHNQIVLTIHFVKLNYVGFMLRFVSSLGDNYRY